MKDCPRTRTLETPLGPLRIEGTPALRRIRFAQEAAPSFSCAVSRQLAEYFEGTRTTFQLELEPEGTTFQKSVWAEVSRIPYGETATYLEIARALGDENLTRAVGAANGANPIPVVIPCHRVIGADGSLTGYAGGLRRKRWLLEHESPQLSIGSSTMLA